MKKIKIKRKGFGFEIVLEGEIKIDESKIKSYEQYHKEQTQALLKKEIYDYLLTICPSANASEFSVFNYYYGAQLGLQDIAEHLATTMEADINDD